MRANAHGRRWWQRRKDTAHLLRLITSWRPDTVNAAHRQLLVAADLELFLAALPLRDQPRHLMEIRGRS